MKQIKGFCTGCHYCDGCPADIPVSAMMQSNNAVLLDGVPLYNRTEHELLKAIQVFRSLYQDFKFLPETTDNPCINCGQCEERCTQHLNIQLTIKRIFEKAKDCCYSKNSHKARLDSLLNNKSYSKVAFFPGAGYSFDVLNQYKGFWGEPRFEVIFFDNNPKLWYTESAGVKIYPPGDMLDIRPDLVLVTSYNYCDEIYKSIQHFSNNGISIRKLHQAADVPWVF